MLADLTEQQELLKLADLDASLARLKHAAQVLPQHQKITELMATRQEVGDALIAAATAVDDAAAAVEKAETDLVPVKARLERDQARVADGSIADAKVLSSLNEEIAHLRRRITTLEDEQLELMASFEAATERRDGLAQRKQAVEEQLRNEVTIRDAEVAKLSQEAKDLTVARSPIAERISPPLLTLYEKLRAASGLGAAALRRGRCGGCQLELTVADLDAYRRAPANEVLRCAECNRILVRTAESGL